MSNNKKYTIEEIVDTGWRYLAPLRNHHRYMNFMRSFTNHISGNNNCYGTFSSAEMYRMLYEATKDVIVNNDFLAPGTKATLIEFAVFFYEKMNEEL